MSISQKHIELFEKYRNGDLSELELKEFNARVSYDSEFKNEFEKYQTIEEGIKTHYRSELKRKLQEIDHQLERDENKKSQIIRLLIWSNSVAAILLLGFFILNQLHSKNEIQIAQDFWPHEEGLPVKMSTKGKYDDAMNAFKLENWEQAERLLLKIDSDTSDYFLGIINYQQKEYQQSKSYFKKVSNGSIYFHEAQFRLALVSILTNDIGSSKVVLRKLIEKDNEYTEQAKKLWSELE